MFWFKKKDPVCGMKEEKGRGMHEENNWFCSKECLKKYKLKKPKTEDCCH